MVLLYQNLTGGVFTQESEGRQFVLWRDKDMLDTLVRRPDAVGFMGSDTFGELDRKQSEQLEFLPIIQSDIRFALCALEAQASRVRQIVNTNGELVVATSYPGQAQRIAAQLGFSLSEIMSWVDRSRLHLMLCEKLMPS